MDSEDIISQGVSEDGSLIEATQSQAFWDSTWIMGFDDLIFSWKGFLQCVQTLISQLS